MDQSLERQKATWDDLPAPRAAVYDLVSAALHATEHNERLRAVESLGKTDDPRAVRPLMDLLVDPDPAIRLSATEALGHLKSGRPVDDLIERLRDRSEQPGIRRQVIITLAAIRSTGALRGLREFAADPAEDPALRASAEHVLQESGTW